MDFTQIDEAETDPPKVEAAPVTGLTGPQLQGRDHVHCKRSCGF